jgi:TPR repeat protein
MRDGQDISIDLTQAVHYFRLSADQGDAEDFRLSAVDVQCSRSLESLAVAIFQVPFDISFCLLKKEAQMRKRSLVGRLKMELRPRWT